MYKNVFTAAASLMIATGSALYGQQADQCPSPAPNKFEQGLGADSGQMNPIYNAPARIDLLGCNPWEAYATVSFIYWHASESGLNFGTAFTDQTIAATPHIGTTPNQLDFKYKPGFKLGTGTQINHDDWMLTLEWTRLHLKDTESKSTTTGFFTNTLAPVPYGTLIETSAAWRLNLDLVDWELSRPFYRGKSLTVEPSFGLRVALIRQKYDDHSVSAGFVGGNVPIFAKVDSKSWAIGPRCGLDGNWLFAHGFRFFGNMAGSILYSHYKTKAFLTFSGLALDVNPKEIFEFLRAVTEIGAGIGWGTYIDSMKWNIDFSAGYDFLVFFNQNTLRYLTNATNDAGSLATLGGSSPSNLYLHGLTVKAKVDF